MAGISSTSALGASITTALSRIGRNKSLSRDKVFAAQTATESAKAAQSEETKTEFIKFSKMSPAERIRAAYLKDHNLTEDILTKIPKEERAKVEEEIKKLMKTKLGLDENGPAGQVIDMTV